MSFMVEDWRVAKVQVRCGCGATHEVGSSVSACDCGIQRWWQLHGDFPMIYEIRSEARTVTIPGIFGEWPLTEAAPSE